MTSYILTFLFSVADRAEIFLIIAVSWQLPLHTHSLAAVSQRTTLRLSLDIFNDCFCPPNLSWRNTQVNKGESYTLIKMNFVDEESEYGDQWTNISYLRNFSMELFDDLDYDELNLTINMFSKDKRQIDEPYYSIILLCYTFVFCLGGKIIFSISLSYFRAF